MPGRQDAGPAPLNRIAVKVAYRGAGFNGSQRQPQLRTAEGEIVRDICEVLRIRPAEVDLLMAGRTDKGVNALGNVAVFAVDFDDAPTLIRALNAKSRRIYYRGYAPVDAGFNPRFAERRVYEYVLPKAGLDVDLVRRCCDLFSGEHDFRRFCRPDGRTTVASIESIDVTEDERNLILTFRARYFLWNMIRRIAAAVATVGLGHAGLDDVQAALDGADVNFGLARADALTLVDTVYPGLEFIPADGRPFRQRLEQARFSLDLEDRFHRQLEGRA